jgi:3'(2'), 5'-bisphosphate nucleotidase
MTVSINDVLLEEIVEIAREASAIILAIYGDVARYGVEQKLDDSPVTMADRLANKLIVARLSAISGLPIISEESPLPDAKVRQTFAQYWLVDPLDGTKGFIAGNGNFTVNIALMQENQPVLGVVMLPTTGEIFAGINLLDNRAAYIYDKETRQRLYVTSLEARIAAGLPLRIMVNRRSDNALIHLLADEFTRLTGVECELLQAGSSLKFCRIAEGRADIYPRFGPTSEWDLAAGHAVLAGAGGEVCSIRAELGELRAQPYNKLSILNGPFCAFENTVFTRQLLQSALYALGADRFLINK